MGLLIDGQIATVDDLAQVDSGAIDVAKAEGINLDNKCLLAQRDCRLKISQFVLNNSLEGKLGMSSNVPRLDRIIVTEGVKNWFTLHTLELLYSDAYYRSLNDRYGKKYEHFCTLTRCAWDMLVDTGLACTYDPVARGSLGAVAINQSPIAPGTYYVAMAWVNSAGISGALSEVHSITVNSGEGFTATPGAAIGEVAGFEVYVGTSPNSLWKQSGGPFESSASYNALNIGEGTGEPPPPVDRIDFVLRKSRSFTRG